MIVDLTTWPDGTTSKSFEVPANVLHLQTDTCIFDGTVRVDLTVHKAQDGLVAEGRATAVAKATCVRCLDEFEIPLDVPFRVVVNVVPDSQVSEDTGDDDFVMLPQGAPVWDLDGLVREHLLVALPVDPLCRPDCAGICAGCGANLNVEACTCATKPPSGALSELRSLIEGASSGNAAGRHPRPGTK